MCIDNEKEIRYLFPETLIDKEFREVSKDLLNKCYIQSYNDTSHKDAKGLYFINMHAYKLQTTCNDDFLYQIDKIKSYTGIKDAYIFNLSAGELLSLQSLRSGQYSYLYSFECDFDSLHIKSNYLRKARKGGSTIQTIRNPKQEDIYCGLELLSEMDFGQDHDDDAVDKDKMIHFFLYNRNAICIVCRKNEQVVGIMLGFLWRKEAYMYIHYYSSKMNKCYINDYMYQEFIKKSKELGAEKVIWGDVHPKDTGLYVFKNHYSTKVTKKYIYIV